MPRTNYLAQGSENISLGGYVGSKFQGFVFDPRLRNIFGQRYSSVDFREILANRRIVLVNLAKGRLTEANSRFMGRLLLGVLQNAALNRAKYDPEDRKPFFLYVDEAHSVASEGLSCLISEGRKFGVGLVLANQYVSQMGAGRMAQSIIGNVGTLIAFRVGPADSGLLEQEMLPAVSRDHLMNLPNRHAFMKALVNGEPTRATAIETVLPEHPLTPKISSRLVEASRRKYARPCRDVEKEISSGFPFNADPDKDG